MYHLVKGLLEVRCAHAFGYMSVRRMREEELSLSSQSSTDVFLPINVLLTAVHNPNVT